MKKLLFLLAFAINASLSFAMTGPVRSVEPKKLLLEREEDVKKTCMVCGYCEDTLLCGIGSTCAQALLALAGALEGSACGETHK